MFDDDDDDDDDVLFGSVPSTLKMIRPKYKEVLLSLLLSLVARNSLAGDILSSPRQLHVRTERSRAAVLVSRSVSSASTAPSATDVQSETGNETTTAAALPASQAHKETGTFELVFAGIHELDNNSVPVRRRGLKFPRRLVHRVDKKLFSPY